MITGITLTGAAFLDKTVNGRESRREGYPPGNRTVWPGAPVMNNYRGPIVAPHNAYRTLGGSYNDWCVIACLSDEEWASLVDLMGRPAWATDETLASLDGRLEHQDDMDRGIEEWTLTLEKYDLADKCPSRRSPLHAGPKFPGPDRKRPRSFGRVVCTPRDSIPCLAPGNSRAPPSGWAAKR